MDIYSTRAQLAAIDLMEPEYSFLYDMFVSDMGAVEDEKAIYDYRKGKLQMAPVVHEMTGGVLMGRTGYETREIGFCTVAPERIITDPDITGRAFGEKILGAMTPEQREKKMLAQDLADMRKAIQRRREHMARQVLLTGKLSMFVYTNEGRGLKPTVLADYGFTQNFTPDTTWDNAGAKIEADMQEMTDMVFEGLGAPEKIVMAPDVANAMLENSKYMKQFDMLSAKLGEINARYKGEGVRFLGYNADGVEMYSFSGKFLDDDGQMKTCMPSGTLIIGGSGLIKMPHGPVTQVEEPGPNARHKTYIKKEVPLRYGSVESNAVKNRLTSRPTAVPFNVDAWVVGHVL
ncbi:MAG: major capsid protein [Clostridiales bacterium]|jgi:hypothetical protein|nr:major capsid protein [Clostridiales bacterium]